MTQVKTIIKITNIYFDTGESHHKHFFDTGESHHNHHLFHYGHSQSDMGGEPTGKDAEQNGPLPSFAKYIILIIMATGLIIISGS